MRLVPTSVRTILILVLLTLPSSASAASVEMLRSSGSHLYSPQLAGESVVVNSTRPDNSVDLVSASPGQPAKRAMHAGSNSSLVAGASGDTILARRSDEGGATEVYSGPLSGPLTKLEGCPQNPDLAFPAAPVIDGNLTAWSAAGCVRDRIHMQLGAVTRTVDATGYVPRLAAAGRYVAWLSNESNSVRLTVYDVQAGQTAYTLPVGGTDQLDVQADGTVALVQPDPGGNPATCHGLALRLTYFTVAEPVAHTVPVSTCFNPVRIASNRIAFAQHLSGGGERLALTNLTGTQVQPVARIDAEPSTYPDFDYDGAHVAWTKVRCRDEVVLRRDAADTSAEDPAVTCPVRVGRPVLRRDGTLHVAVACPNGCRPAPGVSQQGIHIASPRWLHVWGRDRRGNIRYSPFVPVNLQAGKRTVVRLPLTSHQRALLRRRHSVSVRLKVLLQNVYLPRIARTAHG
jgi:hypothetical protein